jgi:hypothetical protein
VKIANLNFVKRNVASVLLTTSVIMSITAATDVMSAPLTISAIIHEDVTPTFLNPASRCTSPLEGTITGTGRSSLLGNVSVEASDCITPNPTQNSFAFNDGKMIFTVLSGEWSGDEIFANYHGEFTPTSAPSIFTFTDAVFKITGGTGDFLHAKGGGKLLGGEDISTGWGVVRATGTISNFIRDQDHKGKSKDHEDRDKDRNTGLNDISTIAGLDNSLLPNRQTLGDFFSQDQNGQLLAVNALPESGSLALLGIGLATLMVIRRRKLANPAN